MIAGRAAHVRYVTIHEPSVAPTRGAITTSTTMIKILAPQLSAGV
ncbi:hypothetical protein [Streptomyces massasporeus]